MEKPEIMCCSFALCYGATTGAAAAAMGAAGIVVAACGGIAAAVA